MLLPISDDMNDYDDPDVVLRWWQRARIAVCGAAILVCATVGLAVATPIAAVASLLSRRPKGEFADPIKAALAKAGEG